MFDHLGIVVTRLSDSRRFYSACLAPLGIELLEDHSHSGGGWLVYGTGRDDPFFVVAGGPPSFWTEANHPGDSPMHIAFTAPDSSSVDQFHREGLNHGGVNNGPPGPRRSTTPYYAAYLLDPNGNNVEAGCRASPDR